MSEADVTYADVKFSKKVPSADVQQPGGKQKSKVSPQRVVLLVLISLLAAAVFALCITVLYLINNEVLQTLKEENEALRRNLSEMNHGVIDLSTCPPPATVPFCINASLEPQLSTRPPPPTVKDETCLKCEEGWKQHGGICYYFSNNTSSWNESRRSCRDQGGDLVKIDSREEQIFLETRLREMMEEEEDRFWIGLTDSEEEGRWVWVDGSALNESLSFWSGIEPDDWKQKNPSGEDCVRMGKKGGTHYDCWFDQSCDVPQKSICEKSAEPGLCSCVCV